MPLLFPGLQGTSPPCQRTCCEKATTGVPPTTATPRFTSSRHPPSTARCRSVVRAQRGSTQLVSITGRPPAIAADRREMPVKEPGPPEGLGSRVSTEGRGAPLDRTPCSVREGGRHAAGQLPGSATPSQNRTRALAAVSTFRKSSPCHEPRPLHLRPRATQTPNQSDRPLTDGYPLRAGVDAECQGDRVCCQRLPQPLRNQPRVLRRRWNPRAFSRVRAHQR